MYEGRITLLAVLVAVFTTLASVSSCASTDHQDKAKSAKMAKKKKKDGLPKNYSLFRPGQIDYKLLRKGQKANYGAALDEY